MKMPAKRSYKMWKREQQAKQRAKADLLTPRQQQRLKVLVSSLTAKPKPAATSKPKPTAKAATAAKPLRYLSRRDVLSDESRLMAAANRAGFNYKSLNAEQRGILRNNIFTTASPRTLRQMVEDAA